VTDKEEVCVCVRERERERERKTRRKRVSQKEEKRGTERKRAFLVFMKTFFPTVNHFGGKIRKLFYDFAKICFFLQLFCGRCWELAAHHPKLSSKHLQKFFLESSITENIGQT
jgi:hypothetical protein